MDISKLDLSQMDILKMDLAKADTNTPKILYKLVLTGGKIFHYNISSCSNLDTRMTHTRLLKIP